MKEVEKKKRQCKHKESYTERIKLPKGDEFSPEIHNELVIRRCYKCRQIIDRVYY